MESGVAPSTVGQAIGDAGRALNELLAAGFEPIDADDAVALIREVESLRRKADAASVEVLAAVDRSGFYGADGHSSAKTMVRHYARLSGGEAAARWKATRVCSALPRVAARVRGGTFGADHLRVLGRVHANSRVRDRMPDSEEWFLRQHDAHGFRDFERLVRRWEKLADDDGPTPRCQVTHERRNARFTEEFDGSWTLTGRFGPAQGAQLSELFDHWVQAEWQADWEKARAEHGDAATAEHLPRTAAQRRADAFWQLFQDAAACPDGAVAPGFVHNIVWDADTFEEMATRSLDPDHEPRPLDLDTMTCRTLDGIDLDPTETIACALRSRIRRAVVDAAGVIVDLGEARLFTGSSRHAVLLSSPRCVWIGCDVPASQCETDHIREHSRGGRTHPGNGAPLCGKHNRWKQKGFTISRLPDGSYSITRPDGTPVPPA